MTKRHIGGTGAATWLVSMVFVFILTGCSRNEEHPKGPAPEAPKETRSAVPVPKSGSGMNQMQAPEAANPVEQPEAKTQAAISFVGEVRLAPDLNGRFPSGATLFVIARDPKERTVPLAAVKLKPEAFPARFAITDADSMTGAPLPREAELLCKLSQSGSVSSSSPGDLEAAPVRAKSGTPATLVLQKK